MADSAAAVVQYLQLFRTLPAAYLLMAPDGTILDSTDQHEAVGMKPRAQIMGQHIFDAFPPTSGADYATFAGSLERVRRELVADRMPVIRYDIERPPAQGGGFEESYWQATHFPLLAPDGTLQFILQQSENVTARHRAAAEASRVAAELTETQHRTAFTLDALPVMVWTASPEGRIDYINERARQFTGHNASSDATIEQSLGRIHPDDRDRVAAARRRAAETGAEYQIEYRLRRHDGAWRWLLARGVPRLATDGQIQMWVGCAIDNHEQRQLVEELLASAESQVALSEQAYAAQRHSNDQRATLHELLMQAPALISIVRGPTFVYEFVNPLHQALFPDRPLLGRPLAEAIPEAVEQGFVAIVERVYTTGEPYIGRRLPFTLPAHDGQPARDVLFDFVYQPFRENGQIVGVLSFAYELTPAGTANPVVA